MGVGQSQNIADLSRYSEEYKITHLDVIQIQSILLSMQQSVSELQKRQEELKRLVLVQNELFTQQNQIIKQFAQVFVDPPDTTDQDNYEDHEDPFTFPADNNNTPLDLPNLQNPCANEEHGKNIADGGGGQSLYPVHTMSKADKDEQVKKMQLSDCARVTKKENTAIKVSAHSGEGIRRLLILDVTVILAKLTSANVHDFATELEILLRKGPILNFNQFEIVTDTILDKIISEPGRTSIYVKLIQKVNVKLSTDHKQLWRKSLMESYRRRLNLSHELQLEMNKLQAILLKTQGEDQNRDQEETTTKTSRTDSDIISIAIDEKYSELQQQYFGIFNFICELFLNHMITPKNLINVGDELLVKILNCEDEFAALNLHTLLSKCGRYLEDILQQVKCKGCYEIGSRGNVITPLTTPNVHWLDTIFESIQNSLTQKKQLSPALRHSLSRLLKLRTNSWESVDE